MGQRYTTHSPVGFLLNAQGQVVAVSDLIDDNLEIYGEYK